MKQETIRTIRFHRPKLVAALVSLLALPGLLQASGPHRASVPPFLWQGEAETVKELTVEISRGSLTVRPSRDDQIRVRIERNGRTAEADGVILRVGEDLSSVSIVAEYPARKSRNDPKTTVTLDVDIRLPPGVAFAGRTEVGDIDARQIDNPIEAISVVGDIRIETASFAEARTTNGNVTVTLGRADWDGTAEFSTTNGDIELAIPPSAHTRIAATSTNGDFDSDLFPVSQSRLGIPGARVRGQLGEGGRLLRMKTVNGDLELRRGTDR